MSPTSGQGWLVNSAPTAEVLNVATCPDGNSLAQSRTLQEVRTELGLSVGKASLQEEERCKMFRVWQDWYLAHQTMFASETTPL